MAWAAKAGRNENKAMYEPATGLFFSAHCQTSPGRYNAVTSMSPMAVSGVVRYTPRRRPGFGAFVGMTSHIICLDRVLMDVADRK